MKLPGRFALAAVLTAVPVLAAAHAETKTEFGEIDGAAYRIDIPENWNGGLVVYCHGYSPKPVTYEQGKPLPPVEEVFTDAGYALAQSGYHGGGWAVEEA